MSSYVVSRLVGLLPVLVLMSVLVFVMVRMIPGDPAAIMAGPNASAADIENIRRELGLDQPLAVQYGIFIVNAVKGDLGRSLRNNRQVSTEIVQRLRPTAELAVASLVVALVIGLPAGVIAGARQYTAWDTGAALLTLIGISTPVFWLGLILQLVFAVGLDALPLSGRDSADSLVLPALTLGGASAAIIARLTRASMLEVLHQDYVRTGWAKGLGERVVVVRHALRNALIPVVTVGGLQFGYLLGGAVITERVFAWPGLGRLLVDGIAFRDYPIVQGTILVMVVAVALVNLGVDLLYSYLDPRVRYG